MTHKPMPAHIYLTFLTFNLIVSSLMKIPYRPVSTIHPIPTTHCTYLPLVRLRPPPIPYLGRKVHNLNLIAPFQQNPSRHGHTALDPLRHRQLNRMRKPNLQTQQLIILLHSRLVSYTDQPQNRRVTLCHTQDQVLEHAARGPPHFALVALTRVEDRDGGTVGGRRGYRLGGDGEVGWDG